ncbi:SCO family protein [Hymenobacter profundi]|uniref:SCO family protein n=1 Tax=Hymenobacter profundi TaxID=1982110 RepID=A0ABS6WWP2_9BACT|nr:SCO family protein [Hymenobacter profundi]MBW3127898.1 SCO family protein [Hymenobacter profundi]
MRPRQTLLLGLMLLVPVLAFLFLKSFGTNHYALPTFFPERVDSTQVGGKWQRDTVYHHLNSFGLTSQSGHPEAITEIAGRGLYVAGFLCANCPGASPEPIAQLARVQELYRQDSQVKLVTYLTAGITPEKAAEQYGAIAGKWWFLAGDSATMRRVADDYHLSTATNSTIQTSNLFLIDRDQQIRGIYDGTKHKEIERLLTEIGVLLYIYEHDDADR